MTARHTLAWIGLVGSVACATTKDAAVPPPVPNIAAESRQLEVTTQSLTEVAVTEKVLVANADAKPATVVGAHWELVFDGKVIAQGDEKLAAALPDSGTVEVPLHGAGTYAADAAAVQALGEHRGGIALALRGTLTVQGAAGGARTVEFAKATDLREPRLPQVIMQDVGASHYDDGHVNVRFVFAIDNPNPFPLKMGGFNYKVEVNGYAMAEEAKGAGVEVPGGSRKEFEETDELTPEKLKDLDALYTKNAMSYHITGTLDLGLAKEDVNLADHINFNH